MKVESEQPIPVSVTTEAASEQGLRRVWAILRSTYHWLLSAAFFFPVCTFLLLLGIFIDPRRNDGAQRMLCRVVMRLAGANLVVRRGAGFVPGRPRFLLIHHVNFFDPFPLFPTVPQFFRGLESES